MADPAQWDGFPINFDAEANVLRFSGPGGISILLTVLLKAKFGEAYDPEMLFHQPLAELGRNLQAAIPARPSRSPDGPFSEEALFRIAEAIIHESWRSGWWSMSLDQRVAYVQNVVVAPHHLSESQLDDLFERVDDMLFNLQRIVNTAGGSGEPPT
jgi:hypothetical protein